MAQMLSETHLEAWRRFYVPFWRITAAIEADLVEAGLPSLSWYDVLFQLYMAPGKHLRMSELANGALMSRSGLTRLVDRLEQERLIERQSCPKDGRVQHAQLTPKGIEMLRKIWPVYRAGIAKYFAAQLTDEQARQFGELMAPIAASMAERVGSHESAVPVASAKLDEPEAAGDAGSGRDLVLQMFSPGGD